MFDDIRNEIKIEAAGSPAFELEAFVRVVARHLEDSEILFDPNIEILNCRGPRQKRLEIVGYSEDLADESLTILVARYFSADETLTLTEAKEVFQRGVWFLEHSIDNWMTENLEFSAREAEYAEYFCSRFSKGQISKVRILLLTDGVMSDRIKVLDSSTIGGVRVNFEIWDQKRLLDADLPELGSEDIFIDFSKWLPDGLPCLESNQGDSSTSTLLAVIPANVLAAIFDEYGSLLLESNVRTFLSARGAVNKGIQSTLAHQPSRFLAYNNGLTTTATQVEVEKSASGRFIKSIKKWQIVNGGQTTASIVHYLRADKTRNVDDVFVQMKLVLVAEDDASEIVQAVAKYANSQNKVTAADLFATHDFHVRMEQISRRLKAPAKDGQQYLTSWFYERARGQWENDRNARGPAGEQKKFEIEFPKSQKITKTYWAKYEYCWAQKPHLVSKGAESVFADFALSVDAEWQRNDVAFNEGYFMQGVAKAIMYETLRAKVLQTDWYKNQAGYLANIVAYTISKFAMEILNQHPGMVFDFTKVWQNQALSDATIEALTEIAKLSQAFLTDPARPQANVTQWAKQPACWDKFKDVSYAIKPSVVSDLVSVQASNEFKVDQKNQQKLVNEVEAAIRILNISSDTWSVVKARSSEVMLSPMEKDYIKIFGTGKGNVPSERQARLVLRMLEKYVANGILSQKDF